MFKFQPASVALSGPGFSFLIHENNNATIGQYGFLLGEIVHKETNSITDNDQIQVDISKIIKINSGVPWPSRNYFPRGRVDKEKIRNLLGTNFSKVVAWYKYGSSNSVQFTLKDKVFNKKFKEIFEMPEDLFCLCILSTENTDSFSTYNYLQGFFRYYDGHYDKLHVSIPNLSESNSFYRKSEPASEAFNKTLSTLKIDIENTKGVVSIAEIENSVRNSIKKTVLELAKVEQHLFKLEAEVELLKQGNRAVETPQTNDNIEDVVMDTSFESTSSNEAVEAPKLSESTETSPRRSQRNVSDSNRKNSQRANLLDTPTPLKGYGRGSGKAKPRGTRGGK